MLVAIVIALARAGRLGMVRAARRHALSRGTEMLRVDVEKRLGEFALAATFETAGRRDRAVRRRPASGKTSIVNMIAGLLTPDRGRIALDDEMLVRHGRGRSTSRRTARRIGYVFQDGRLFPHLTCGKTSTTAGG